MLDEQALAAIEQVFATVTHTLRTGSRGDGWRYDVTLFEEAGSALLAEARRLRAGLQWLAENPRCAPTWGPACWVIADDVLDGKPPPSG